MFHTALRPLLLAASLAALTGCLAQHSYIDPSRRVPPEDLRPVPAQPRPVVVTAEFQVNGKVKKKIGPQLQPVFMQDLTLGGHFRPARAGEPADRIEITLNNVGDLGEAAMKGVGTGLTFGLAGSHVTDGYLFTARITTPDGRTLKQEYRNEIVSTVGLTRRPPGLEEMKIPAAVDHIIFTFARMLIRGLLREGFFPVAPPAASPALSSTGDALSTLAPGSTSGPVIGGVLVDPADAPASAPASAPGKP